MENRTYFQDRVNYEEEHIPNLSYRGVLFNNGERAGHIVLEKVETCSLGDIPLEFSEWFYITDLFIPKPFRGRRHSSFLTDQAISFSRRVNVPILSQIDSYAGLESEKLIAASLRHGFKKLDTIFLYFDPKINPIFEKFE